MVACAATLHATGAHVHDARDAVHLSTSASVPHPDGGAGLLPRPSLHELKRSPRVVRARPRGRNPGGLLIFHPHKRRMPLRGRLRDIARMANVLLIYATTHGHTAKIAARVADALRDDGLGVDLLAVDASAAPSDYDRVIVGASVHQDHHQREIVDWASHHAVTLSAMPSALFSVCLTAADDSDEAREATRGYLDDFEDGTGWTPGRRTSFAGALQYHEYDFVTRLLMRLLMSRGGHPTDTSRDHEYTDWDAVDGFAHEFGGSLD